MWTGRRESWSHPKFIPEPLGSRDREAGERAGRGSGSFVPTMLREKHLLGLPMGRLQAGVEAEGPVIPAGKSREIGRALEENWWTFSY